MLLIKLSNIATPFGCPSMTSLAALALLQQQAPSRSDLRTGLALVKAVKQGFPLSALDAVVGSGALSWPEVERLIIPRRTLVHRRQKKLPLSPEQSDRLGRVTRVLALADETLGTPAKTHHWMRTPNGALGGVAPLELLDTDGGATLVEQVLVRLAHGIYS